MARNLGKGWSRDTAGRVVVQFYDPKARRSSKVPRAECDFLDAWSDDKITEWVSKYREANRAQAARTLRRVLLQSDPLQVLFDAFLDQRAKNRHLEKCTVVDERTRWERHIVPFMVDKHGLKDVRSWDTRTYDLTAHLVATKALETNQQKKVLRLVDNFGKHLAAINVLPKPWVIIYPTDNAAAATPLEVDITPQDVLNFAKKAPKPVALLALLGYFGSLRGEETFALKKEDFYTKALTQLHCLTQPRFAERGIGSMLSVNIERALNKSGKVGAPKTKSSAAVVNIWDPRAAVALGAILRTLPNGYLFPGKSSAKAPSVPRPLSRETLFKLWQRERGNFEVSVHDLRRGSGFYLGRKLDLPLTLIQDHFRHADIKTTMTYLRPPAPKAAPIETQDWDSLDDGDAA